MGNMNNDSFDNSKMDETLAPVEAVIGEGSFGKSKGLLIGVAAVGAGALAFSLYRRIKKNKSKKDGTVKDVEEDVVD